MTPGNYEAALAELKALMDADPAGDSPQGVRLKELASLLHAYEGKQFPIAPFRSATCEGEICACGQPADAKIGEEIAHDDPNPNRHNLTTYVCRACFDALLSPHEVPRPAIVRGRTVLLSDGFNYREFDAAALLARMQVSETEGKQPALEALLEDAVQSTFRLANIAAILEGARPGQVVGYAPEDIVNKVRELVANTRAQLLATGSMDAAHEVAREANEERRWKWVLEQLARYAPDVPPERFDEPRLDSERERHLSWITREGPRSHDLQGNAAKAMRWACWAQGVLFAWKLLPLADAKRLNMRATWEAAHAAGIT